MHDAIGRDLMVGDLVLIPVRIKQLSPSEEYCNVTLESVLGRRPDGNKEMIYAINTGVVLRANVGDKNDLATLAFVSGELVISAARNHAETD